MIDESQTGETGIEKREKLLRRRCRWSAEAQSCSCSGRAEIMIGKKDWDWGGWRRLAGLSAVMRR